MSSNFTSPFMARSPLNQKTREQKLRQKIKDTRKKAFIKSNSSSEDYEKSRSEKRAEKKLSRQEKRLDRIVKRNTNKASALDQKEFGQKEPSIVETDASKEERELSQETKDSLQQKACKRDKPFYSKKHGKYVECEDGVLTNTPTNTSTYEKI
jgi:acyl-coenzyme A synthetase/AMP-(fatty) acid ligase